MWYVSARLTAMIKFINGHWFIRIQRWPDVYRRVTFWQLVRLLVCRAE